MHWVSISAVACKLSWRNIDKIFHFKCRRIKNEIHTVYDIEWHISYIYFKTARKKNNMYWITNTSHRIYIEEVKYDSIVN